MNVSEYKCPCCGAPIIFDSVQQLMACQSCGNTFSVDTVQAFNAAQNDAQAQDNYGWQNYAEQNAEWHTDDSGNPMHVYICPSCGGEIITDSTTAATKCPYCDNNTILNEQLSGSFRPNYVIPFKITKEQAIEKLNEFAKGKKLLPSLYSKNRRIESIHGIYVPFWLFDCNSNANMQYNATQVSSWVAGDYRYTKTDYYLLRRDGTMTFEHVPVDGSMKMPDEYMESIEPYDFSEMVPFNSAYLSGYMADKYDVDDKTSQQRANFRIKNTTEQAFNSTTFGYASVIPTHTGINFSEGKISYALLPVWMLNTIYEGKSYMFAMNGQTSKYVGELPVSKGKYWAWTLGLLGGIGLILSLLFSFI